MVEAHRSQPSSCASEQFLDYLEFILSFISFFILFDLMVHNFTSSYTLAEEPERFDWVQIT
jgi:hypothetical protein